MKRSYDAIIIGSGFGACPPALRLTRAGLSVLILEKGPNIDSKKDFKNTQDPGYLLKYLKALKSETVTMNYAEGLGGGSGFFEKIVLRAPSMVFDQKDIDGYRFWPDSLNRKVMDPYYQRAETMIHAHQIKENHIPKTGYVFSLMMNKLNYSIERCRYADFFCNGCGYCVFGCKYGRKESLLENYLPKAKEKGAEIITNMEVIAIKPKKRKAISREDHSSIERYEITAHNLKTDTHIVFRSKLLILAAGTIGTTKILLQSKRFLPKLSTQVGKNVAINGSVRKGAVLPAHMPDGDMFSGQSHPGIISYEFFKSHGLLISAFKALPLQIFGTARLMMNKDDPFWGKPNTELLKKLRKRMIFLDAHGTTLPSATLSLSRKNEMKVHMKINNYLAEFHESTMKILDNILIENGCKLVNFEYINGKGIGIENLHFHTAHQVGSCRMSEIKDKGVVDEHGEVYGYPDMYITDGASIPTSTGVNISLTILANAERITDGILKASKNKQDKMLDGELI